MPDQAREFFDRYRLKGNKIEYVEVMALDGKPTRVYVKDMTDMEVCAYAVQIYEKHKDTKEKLDLQK
jgi:hypothetical protein